MKKLLALIIAFVIIPSLLLSQDGKNENLFKSIGNCDKENIINLLDGGADIKSENNAGWSPLDFAILNSCSKDIIELLIEKYGADINHLNKTQKNQPTIYLLIFYKGKEKEILLKYLLEKGAENSTYKDENGFTMLDYFKKNGEDAKLYEYLYNYQKKNMSQNYPYSESIDNNRRRCWLDKNTYTDSVSLSGWLYYLYEIKINENRKKIEEKIIRYTPAQFGGKPWVITQIKYGDNEKPINNKATIICYYDLSSPQIENYEEYESIIEYMPNGYVVEKQKDGLYIAKYPNGNTKISGQYVKGYKDGKWLFYDTNGRVEEKEYKEDKEISK